MQKINGNKKLRFRNYTRHAKQKLVNTAPLSTNCTDSCKVMQTKANSLPRIRQPAR